MARPWARRVAGSRRRTAAITAVTARRVRVNAVVIVSDPARTTTMISPTRTRRRRRLWRRFQHDAAPPRLPGRRIGVDEEALAPVEHPEDEHERQRHPPERRAEEVVLAVADAERQPGEGAGGDQRRAHPEAEVAQGEVRGQGGDADAGEEVGVHQEPGALGEEAHDAEDRQLPGLAAVGEVVELLAERVAEVRVGGPPALVGHVLHDVGDEPGVVGAVDRHPGRHVPHPVLDGGPHPGDGRGQEPLGAQPPPPHGEDPLGAVLGRADRLGLRSVRGGRRIGDDLRRGHGPPRCQDV